MNREGVSAQVVFSVLFVFLFPVLALSQTPFYQGKTITLVAGVKAGDTGDMRARVIVNFFQEVHPWKSDGCLSVHAGRWRSGGNQLHL